MCSSDQIVLVLVRFQHSPPRPRLPHTTTRKTILHPLPKRRRILGNAGAASWPASAIWTTTPKTTARSADSRTFLRPRRCPSLNHGPGPGTASRCSPEPTPNRTARASLARIAAMPNHGQSRGIPARCMPPGPAQPDVVPRTRLPPQSTTAAVAPISAVMSRRPPRILTLSSCSSCTTYRTDYPREQPQP